MMHEPEKSDSAVVAMKSTNNAEQSAAESVERRAGTKGNVGQQSTRRAQDRESVSQALERVRQAARQRKKEQFTSLLHHVDPAMLRTAFYALKRDAAPGVDGMTWEAWTYGTSIAGSRTCMRRSKAERTGRCRPAGATFRRNTAASVRSRLRPSKTRSSKRAMAAGAERDPRGRLPRVLVRVPTKTLSQHDALDALIVGISSKKVNSTLDADIRSFFTEVSEQ